MRLTLRLNGDCVRAFHVALAERHVRRRPVADHPAALHDRQPVGVGAPEEGLDGFAAARQFDQQMRLLQNTETADKAASQLLSVQG